MTRVVILGGGIAGLTAAFRRASAGETVVLEAGPQAGGSIRTIREDGFALECGPNTLRTTEAAERLLADLGLEPRTVKADSKAPRWIVRGGSPRAVVPGPAALFNKVFTAKGKLRLLKEPFVAPRPASLEDESVHSFFARRFGEEAALYGAGPMVSGVYAGDPRSLSMRSAFPRLWEAEGAAGSVVRGLLRKKEKKGAAGTEGKAKDTGATAGGPRHRPRTLTFDAGLFTLIETLQQRLASRPGFHLELNAAVVAIEGPRTPAPPGRRWTVRIADGRAFDADVLASTLSAPADARLLGGVLTRSASALLACRPRPSRWSCRRTARRIRQATLPAASAGSSRRWKVSAPSASFTRRRSSRGGRPKASSSRPRFSAEPSTGRSRAHPTPNSSRSPRRKLARFFPRLGPAARSWIARWPEAIPQPPLGHHRTLAALEGDLAALDALAPGALHVTGGFRDGIALGERIASGEAIGKSLA